MLGPVEIEEDLEPAAGGGIGGAASASELEPHLGAAEDDDDDDIEGGSGTGLRRGKGGRGGGGGGGGVEGCSNPPLKNCFRLVLVGSSKVGKTSIVSRFLDNKYDDKYTPTIENFHRKVYRIRGESYRLDILDTSGNDPFPAMRRLSLMTGRPTQGLKCPWTVMDGVQALLLESAHRPVTYLARTAEKGDLFIVVYSIDNRKTFEEAQRLQQQIFDYKGSSSSAGIGIGSLGGGSSTGGGGGGSVGPSSWRKRKPYVPMVIAGNKCELRTGSEALTSATREVETWELMRLAENRPSVGCLETSAKRNINIEEIFLKLFMLAKLPTEMTPSLHRKVTPSFVVTSSPRGSRRRMTLRRRLSDACGAVALDVRRPSIRTDLLIVKAKQQMEETEKEVRKREKKRCNVQ